MDTKLKKLLLKLQQQEKDITGKALEKGKQTTQTDIVVGAFNLAQFNSQMLIKLFELFFQQHNDRVTVRSAEEKLPTTH